MQNSQKSRPTNRQLGKRRRTALLAVLAIAAVAVYFFCFRSDEKADTEIPETAAVSETAVETEALVGADDTALVESESETAEATQTLPAEPDTLSLSQANLNVTPVLQNPELPTGCEVTSLTMALNYAGYDVDKLTLTDKYLICAEPYQTTFGEAFVGSPYDENAWGCYAPVIVKTAESYLQAQGSTDTVQNLTGCSLKTLLQEVANGTPVITWVTINLTDRVEERTYWTTPDGEEAVFLINEHCVLLCGYDLSANTVTVCDPLEGKISYDMTKFEDRYELMYEQAVVIRKAEENTGTEAAQ